MEIIKVKISTGEVELKDNVDSLSMLLILIL
jgi:hypothetical protein